MDINIKGGGLTRTVKCDCPDVQNFPITLGQKLSDQEVRDLQIKFSNTAYDHNKTPEIVRIMGGLSVESYKNYSHNNYIVFFNIPMVYSSVVDITISGAFMILPGEWLSKAITLFSVFPLDSQYDIKSGIDTNNYIEVYPINQM